MPVDFAKFQRGGDKWLIGFQWGVTDGSRSQLGFPA